MEYDSEVATPRTLRPNTRPLRAMDIKRIARPGSLDILQSPSRIGDSLFYPNGDVTKNGPAILKEVS